MRETEEVVEKIGVERSLDLAQKSDLVLMLCSSTASDEIDYCKQWMKRLGEENVFLLKRKPI